MSKFLSGRLRRLLVGITGYTENNTVVQTTGKVGIGTTDAQQHSLYVVGSTNITDATIVGGGFTAVGIGSFQSDVSFEDRIYVYDRAIFDSTNSIQIPSGTEAQKDAIGVAVTGQIRFNTTNQQFEGFGVGNNWGSLGGVKDVDGDTEIKAELSAGSDEDTLFFYTGGNLSGILSTTGADFNVDVNIDGNLNVSGVTTIFKANGSDLLHLTRNTSGGGSNLGFKFNVNNPSANLTTLGITRINGNTSILNITDQGVIYPSADGSVDLGRSSNKFDNLYVKNIDSTISISGVTTFTNTTDNTLGDADTGAVQIDGGLGVNKNVTVGAGLSVVSGFNVAGVSTFQNNVHLLDDDRLQIGGSVGTVDGLEIYHDGSNSYIADTGTGAMQVSASAIIVRSNVGENMAQIYSNGAVKLFYNNSQKFETTGIGVSVSSGTGLTATIAGPPNLIIDPGTVGDDTGLVRIKGDLYVDGTEFKVDSSTINLADLKVGIATAVGTNLLLDGGGIGIGSANIEKTILWSNSNSRMEFNADLYAPNFTTGDLNATTSTVTGISTNESTLFAQQLNVAGLSTFHDTVTATEITAPTGSTLEISGGGVGSANAKITFPQNDTAEFKIEGAYGGSANLRIDSMTSGNVILQTGNNSSNATITLQPNVIDLKGHTELDSANISGNLNVSGLSTFQDNVHLLDNDKLLIGGSVGTHDGLEIYHDSNHSYIDDSGTGNLHLRSGTLAIQNLAGTKTSAVFNSGAEQELRFNNSKKFETTGIGVSIYDNLNVGTAVTVYGNSGIVSATTLDTQDITISGGISTDGYDTGNQFQLLRANGNGGWEWATVPGIFSVNNILNGFNVYEEGLIVGTAGSIHTLDFRGINVTASADPQPNGIATVTFSPTPSFTTVDVDYDVTVGAGLTVDGRIVGAATSNVIPFLYANLTDLPSAGTYHGAFAHVHSEGAAYFAHANNWYELVNKELNGDVKIGTGITMYASTGIVSATAFYGDGSNLLNTGATLSAATGTQRIVLTSLTSGTMVDAATDADLAYNASDDRLIVNNLDISGITTLGGPVTAGSSEGVTGQYLRNVGTGVTWANFPTLRVVGVNTATAGQTAFNFVYNVDFLDVFVNGVKLSPSEYTATNGNQIVLNTAAFADEIVEFHSYNVASTYGSGSGGGGGGATLLGNLNDVNINTLVDDQVLQYNSVSGRWENIAASTIVGAASSFATKDVTRTTATANQTTFNGTYTVGFVDVYFNGAKLSEDQYTATTGTNIVLNAGAAVNDIVEVVGLTANVPGSSYTNSHVDLHLNTSTATSGQVLSWNGSDYDWVADQIGSVGAGGTWATDDVGINTTKSIGIGTTAKDGYKLYVEGDARVTGILTVGPASVTIDGINNEVTVGTGITLYGNTGIISATSLNVTASLNGDGSALTGLTGASAATYGNGTAVPQITVDANGRITGITNVSISGGGGGGGTSLFIKDSGSLVGAAGTIDFGTGLSVSTVSAGIVTVTASSSGISLTDLSVTQNSAGSATLSYDDSTGVFSYTPPDLSTYLTSYTETDPVVGAVNGIVKANGSGTISAATAGTDYLAPGSEFTSQWTFTASDSSNYQVTGPGFAANSTDPTIYVMRGHKYKFTNNAGSHPLQIQYEFENSGGTAYTDGITNSNNVITWEVRNDTPDLLHYQCTSHGNMSGRIVVLGDVVTNGSWTASAGTAQAIDTITGVSNNAIKTAEYTVHIENGSNMQSQKVLVMQNGTTAYSQEYAIMYTSTNPLVTITADINSGNLRLLATPSTGVTGGTTYTLTRQTIR